MAQAQLAVPPPPPVDLVERHIAELRSIGFSVASAVAPCNFGQVDRCCLRANAAQSMAQCDPFVNDTMDENVIGERTRVLGQGNYGIVYATTRNFVIKCSKWNRQAVPGIPDTDLREISLLRNLVHPNVIQIHQVSLQPTMQCNTQIVLPFYRDTLRSRFMAQQRRFNLEERALYMFQLLRAVAYIHSRSVWHLDIKPENILVDQGNHLVLADFGLAQGVAIDGPARSTNVVTLWYRAPELILGDAYFNGAAVDVWAVGATWLDLLNITALHARQGRFEAFEQLLRTFLFVGKRTDVWPQSSQLPNFSAYSQYVLSMPKEERLALKNEIIPINLALHNMRADDREQVIVKQMLTVDPTRRTSAERVMAHTMFDNARQRVQTTLPTTPLPTASPHCVDVLLATELPPAGNYLLLYEQTGQVELTKEMIETGLQLMNQLCAYRNDNWSTFAVTSTLLIRVLSKPSQAIQLGATVNDIALTCYMIATKLDSGARILDSREAEQIAVNTRADRFVQLEHDISVVLDMDYDRPSAHTFWMTFTRGKSGEAVQASANRLIAMLQDYTFTSMYRGSQLAFAACKEAGLGESECMAHYATQYTEWFA